MKKSHITKFIYAALFVALIFAGTQLIHIPLPFGYFHLGDCLILLSALLLGGPYAVIASALGSALADVLSGYVLYVPATLLIKGGMAAVMTAALALSTGKNSTHRLLLLILGGALAELLMAAGYFLYDALIYGLAGALASLSGNILQGVTAVILGTLITSVLEHGGILRRIQLK